MKKLGFWTLIVALAAVAGGTLSYKPWKAFFEQRSTREHEAHSWLAIVGQIGDHPQLFHQPPRQTMRLINQQK